MKAYANELEKLEYKSNKISQPLNSDQIKQKEKRLSYLQHQSGKTRQRLVEIQTKIESTKEKLKKTTSQFEKIDSSRQLDESSGKNDLLEKFSKLNTNLKTYEVNYKDAIEVINACDEEIRKIKKELGSTNDPDEYKTEPRENFENFKYADEIKQKYEKYKNQYKDYENKLRECDKKIIIAQNQIDEINSKIASHENDKRIFIEQLQPKRMTEIVSPTFYETEGDEIPQSDENVKNLKKYLLNMVETFTDTLNLIQHENGEYKANIEIFIEMIQNLNNQDASFKDISTSVSKLRNEIQGFNKDLKSLFENKNSQIKNLQIRMDELVKLNYKSNSKKDQENADYFKLKEDKNEILRDLKGFFSNVIQYQTSFKNIEEDYHFEDLIPTNLGSVDNIDKLDEAMPILKKFLKHFEKFISKADSINQKKVHALKELEKEKKDLASKKKELDEKATQLQEHSIKEREYLFKEIDGERKQIQEEKNKWESEKARLDRERENILSEFNRLMKKKKAASEEYKLEEEKLVKLKEDLEASIKSLSDQNEAFVQTLEEGRNQAERLRTENEELLKSIGLESQTKSALNIEIEELAKSKSELESKCIETKKHCEQLSEEEKRLNTKLRDIKSQSMQLEQEFIESISRLKSDEKEVKKQIQSYEHDLNFKKKTLKDTEDKLKRLEFEIADKQREEKRLEKVLQEIINEREKYRENKKEMSQLSMSLEEARLQYKDINTKIQFDESKLSELTKQIDVHNSLVKVKQNDIMLLEKKNSALHEVTSQLEVTFERSKTRKMEIENEICHLEGKKEEAMKELNRIQEKLNDTESIIEKRTSQIEELRIEFEQKSKELNNITALITESEIKYQNSCKENEEKLERMIKDIRDRENKIGEINLEIGRIEQQKLEMINQSQRYEREIKNKEEALNKIISNLDSSKKSIELINSNLLIITEKEAVIEAKLKSEKEKERLLDENLRNLKHEIDMKIREKKDLETMIAELKSEEATLSVGNAWRGQEYEVKAQEKVRNLVQNRGQINQLYARFDEIKKENNIVKQHLAQSVVSDDQSVLLSNDRFGKYEGKNFVILPPYSSPDDKQNPRKPFDSLNKLTRRSNLTGNETNRDPSQPSTFRQFDDKTLGSITYNNYEEDLTEIAVDSMRESKDERTGNIHLLLSQLENLNKDIEELEKNSTVNHNQENKEN